MEKSQRNISSRNEGVYKICGKEAAGNAHANEDNSMMRQQHPQLGPGLDTVQDQQPGKEMKTDAEENQKEEKKAKVAAKKAKGDAKKEEVEEEEKESQTDIILSKYKFLTAASNPAMM